MVVAPDRDLKPRRTSARLKSLQAKTSSPPAPRKRAAAASSSSSSEIALTDKTLEDEIAQPATASSKKMVRKDKKLKDKTAKSIAASSTREMARIDKNLTGEIEESTAAKVTETLRIFNKYYLQFIQKEESRCAKEKADSSESQSKPMKRPDLKAITAMREMNETLNPDKRIGSIPGIDVGHRFYSRAEMVAVGIHHHWLAGIDYIGNTGPKSRNFLEYTLPLATSIVLSGQYQDNVDHREQIVYTGQGGNNLLGDKTQFANQVLTRGNLGLKNAMEQSVDVRVIRGHTCESSYVGKVYTYDGLYKVTACWEGKGEAGFKVYKFSLERVAGQPDLETKEVRYIGRISKLISKSNTRGSVCKDIATGLENICIHVTNEVDDPPISPPPFVYMNKLKFSTDVAAPTAAPKGCRCLGGLCTDPELCACAKLNGGDFPYVKKGGRLVEPAAVVFECGPNCGCGPNCVNRTSQRGLRFRLDVFRTSNKGWGVRSWDFIPSGAPVCEYIGLVRRSADAANDDDTYAFDIDCLQTMKGLDGRESRLRDVSLPSHLRKIVKESSGSVAFCIDAAQTGNVARFINHSCEPNLFVQCVLSDHHDLKLARIILIAADNIPPMTELTYDYGYELDSVTDAGGEIRRMPCFCGAKCCRKRLF